MFLKIKSFFKSRIFKRILLLMGSCIIAFLLGEITVYFLYKEKIVLFPRYVTDAQYNDFQIRRNLPDHSYKHTSFDGKWEFKINSQGFRDIRDFKYEKPKEVLRVLVLGDSFTIGYEVRQNQTYSAVLEAYLKRKGIQAEVINAGMSGNSNAEELIFYEQEGVRYQPDIIILGFYHNDLEDNLRSNLYSLKEGQLLVKNKTYLPGIKIGNFLNRFSLYRFLNENSYLVNFINMGITAKIKEQVLEKNKNELQKENQTFTESLAQNIIKKIYSIAQENHSYFILLDIPKLKDFTSSFPLSPPVSSFADYYLESTSFLSEYLDLVDLYQPHGHRHWTEFSHLHAGIELGKIILKYLENKKQE